jgi:DNA-binding CsgD family transcriptional regulator
MELVVAYGWLHVAAAARTGDPEEAERATAAALAAAPGNRDIAGLLLANESFAALLADDLPRALDLAERGSELLRGSETAPPAHPRATWPVLLALTHRPEAATAVEELERAGLAVNPAGRAWLILARAILAGHSDPALAAALAAEADELLAQLPGVLWRALTRRLAAQAAAMDRWPIPGHWLGDAETCLRRRGYPAAAAACRALRGHDQAAVPAGWARLGITRREADVLTLLIEGHPNREIAERLYLSVRTVEKHIEALLRKTGTKTRTQLARLTGTT